MWLLSWGPKFLGQAGRPQFVSVACTTWVGTQPWFAPTNTTLVLRQVFEDQPQLSKELTPGMLSLGSGSTPFVPAATGIVYRLFFSLLAPFKAAGPILRQGCDVAGPLSPFLPWSLSLQHFVGVLQIYLLHFLHPIRSVEGVKHKHLLQSRGLSTYPLRSRESSPPHCLLETATLSHLALAPPVCCELSGQQICPRYSLKRWPSVWWVPIHPPPAIITDAAKPPCRKVLLQRAAGWRDAAKHHQHSRPALCRQPYQWRG